MGQEWLIVLFGLRKLLFGDILGPYFDRRRRTIFAELEQPSEREKEEGSARHIAAEDETAAQGGERKPRAIAPEGRSDDAEA